MIEANIFYKKLGYEYIKEEIIGKEPNIMKLIEYKKILNNELL